jgi:hypothetical protein
VNIVLVVKQQAAGGCAVPRHVAAAHQVAALLCQLGAPAQEARLGHGRLQAAEVQLGAGRVCQAEELQQLHWSWAGPCREKALGGSLGPLGRVLGVQPADGLLKRPWPCWGPQPPLPAVPLPAAG